MTKVDLIGAVAKDTEATKAEAEKFVKSFLETVAKTIASGETVSIAGFGNFEVGERAARKGRNPKTGESIEIPASKSLKFKPAKALKDALKAGGAQGEGGAQAQGEGGQQPQQ